MALSIVGSTQNLLGLIIARGLLVYAATISFRALPPDPDTNVGSLSESCDSTGKSESLSLKDRSMKTVRRKDPRPCTFDRCLGMDAVNVPSPACGVARCMSASCL